MKTSKFDRNKGKQIAFDKEWRVNQLAAFAGSGNSDFQAVRPFPKLFQTRSLPVVTLARVLSFTAFRDREKYFTESYPQS